MYHFHFSEMPDAAILGHFPADRAAAALRTALFSEEERTVLHLASRDHVRSTEQPSRLRRGAEWLFNIPRARGLADPRLEALRQAAIVARTQGAVPCKMAAAMSEYGFSPMQVRALHRAEGDR